MSQHSPICMCTGTVPAKDGASPTVTFSVVSKFYSCFLYEAQNVCLTQKMCQPKCNSGTPKFHLLVRSRTRRSFSRGSGRTISSFAASRSGTTVLQLAPSTTRLHSWLASSMGNNPSAQNGQQRRSSSARRDTRTHTGPSPIPGRSSIATEMIPDQFTSLPQVTHGASDRAARCIAAAL